MFSIVDMFNRMNLDDARIGGSQGSSSQLKITPPRRRRTWRTTAPENHRSSIGTLNTGKDVPLRLTQPAGIS